jgi:hypothetical protein
VAAGLDKGCSAAGSLSNKSSARQSAAVNVSSRHFKHAIVRYT